MQCNVVLSLLQWQYDVVDEIGDKKCIYPPDGRYFQDIPFHRHIKLAQIHADIHHVTAGLFVHVPEVDLDINRIISTA